jgi:cell division protease FtsH
MLRASRAVGAAQLMSTPAPPGKPAPPEHPRRWRLEGAPDPESPPKQHGPMGLGRRIWIWIAVLLVINLIVSSQFSNAPSRLPISYTYFVKEVNAGNVADITSTGDTIQGDFKKVTAPPSGMKGTPAIKFKTQLPTFVNNDKLDALLAAKGVVINANNPDATTPLWQELLLGFGPTLLIVALFVIISRRLRAGIGGSGGPLGAFGKSKARRYEVDEQRVTFKDVAGIDEATDELSEVVAFLKSPEKYTRLGARVPRGVLLSGAPGTGKTLLARAVAGEADVPFFSIAASEFIEAIVGVGASRVRDLFTQAKAAAPAIIFIDELDAIGRARGSGSFGGNDEREQTLNQILTEMDGFTGSEGVIVIAATNRPEVLDPALLRAGRFDRRVVVNAPDQLGRQQILAVHTRSVPLAADVDLASLASSTSGMVGADLANLVNEAALLAARRGHDKVALADFTDALEKIVLGTQRHIVLSESERERTAYHESGHALLGMLITGSDPVRKISIIPRGRALGVTFQSPDADRYGYSADYLRGRLTGALGGRAAEELIYHDQTTGAESDLEQATHLARQMVGRWGMSSEVGPVSVLPGPGDESMLFPGGGADGVSEHTREQIDAEVRRLLEECEAAAIATLKAHREQLDALSRALLTHETLDEADAYRIAGVDRQPNSVAAATAPVAGDP